MMAKPNNKSPRRRVNKEKKIFNMLSSTREKKQILPKSIWQKIHFGIEFCGKHPFVTGLFTLISLVGFGLSIVDIMDSRRESAETAVQSDRLEKKADKTNSQLVKILVNNSQILSKLDNNKEYIKTLEQTIRDLRKGEGTLGSKAQIEVAMTALAQGDTEKAKQIFSKAAQKGEQEALETAKAYRNLGALAFLDNTQQALKAYRRATELNPNNPNSWNPLGLLFNRVGELDQAIVAYNKVLAWGENHQDKKYISIAYTNLGNVYQTRGELDKAIEFYQKSLAIEEALGRKEGLAINYTNLGVVYKTRGEMDKAIEFYQKSLAIYEALGRKAGLADNYGNLGIVYQTRGELDKAIEFYQKSLAIYEALGHKEGLASIYANLGVVYQKRGNPAEAKRYWLLSLKLFKKVGSPNAQRVQSWLDGLAEVKK